MNTYHKIQTVFKRDPETKYKTLLLGEYSLPEFKFLKNNNWVLTDEVDGTNIRIIFDGHKITIKGKTDKAQIPTFLLDELEKLTEDRFLNFAEEFNTDVCLYGEGYGPRIQKIGEKYTDTPSFVLFDVKIGNIWLCRKDIETIAGKLSLTIVPIIGCGTLEYFVDYVKSGFKSRWGDFIAEGAIAKPEVELKTRMGSRVVTKLKHKDFVQEGK